MRVPRHPSTVYLHIGPPKTGTTYLQEALWRNKRRLAEQGVTFPGRPIDHFRAALDLRGLSFGGYDDPATEGAWDELAKKTMACNTRSVVISHEVLAAASTEHIQTALRSLQPAQVHVIYGARDLARQIPAVWQESLKNRRKRTYPRFLRAVLSYQPGGGNHRFWSAQNAVEVLARWGKHLPADHIHVVTLPQRTGDSNALWERFCAVLGIDADGFDMNIARTNVSLATSEAEVLRRLNVVLPEDLSWPDYERLVKNRFNQLADRGSAGQRLRVPNRHRDQVLKTSDAVRRQLAEAGYDIVGDLDDLIPADDAFGPVKGLKTGRVADAAVEVLATVLTADPSRTEKGRHEARRLIRALRPRGNR